MKGKIIKINSLMSYRCKKCFHVEGKSYRKKSGTLEPAIIISCSRLSMEVNKNGVKNGIKKIH